MKNTAKIWGKISPQKRTAMAVITAGAGIVMLIAAFLLFPAKNKGPYLTELAVYGESALIEVEAARLQQYLLEDIDNGNTFTALAGAGIDEGLPLWLLPPGDYLIMVNAEPDTEHTPDIDEASTPKPVSVVTAAEMKDLEGYTLPREGIRKHWRFSGDNSGRLRLSIEEITSLPENFADVFIDIGHGGKDTGAAAFGRLEAEENLRSGRLLGQILSQYGLKIVYSRIDNNISGGRQAEYNPYLQDARVDKVYQSGAAYLISNHLNGGGNSGWQIYTSIHASTAWADAIGKYWKELGHEPDNSNAGLLYDGIYKRHSEENFHRDYYFILRETGGEATTPFYYRRIRGSGVPELRRGANGILLEYLFLDNRQDMEYWDQHLTELVEAAAKGCIEYWQLDQPINQ